MERFDAKPVVYTQPGSQRPYKLQVQRYKGTSDGSYKLASS